MSTRDDVTVMEMFRELPAESGFYTFGPFLLASAQVANGFVNELPMTYPALFATVMVLFSVLITQYHLVEFRITRLQEELF